MNHLSSRFTLIFLYIVFPVLGIEMIYLVSTMQLPNKFLLVIPAVVIGVAFFYLRKVRAVRYDDGSLYVRGLLKLEKISMTEVSSVNIPDSWSDRIYQIELKSGRIIEFIPSFASKTFIWQKLETPSNVRRFQTILREFERKQAS